MDNIFSLSPLALAAAPLVLGLVAVIRQVGLPSRFAPLGSIILGIGLVALTGIEWQAFIVQGIIVGLVASGLWSGSKALFTPSEITNPAIPQG